MSLCSRKWHALGINPVFTEGLSPSVTSASGPFSANLLVLILTYWAQIGIDLLNKDG